MKLKTIITVTIIITIIIQTFFTSSCLAKPKDEYTIVLNGADDDKVETAEDENKKIYSESAILMEKQTGKILYEKNIYDRKYPASTTKALTAIIALEKCNLDEVATASEYAVSTVKADYTNANIKAGESFTIGELLDVMMIVSANEAATIIAEHISGSEAEFAKLMNEKAKEIGCLDSHFVNANGIHDDNHYTTAYDLALIARYCIQNEKFREIVSKKTCSLPVTDIYENAIKTEIEQENEKNKNKKKYVPKKIEDISLERNFRNTNSLLKEDSVYYYPYCIGGKTGYTTPAKNCLISFSDKDGFETISVILHAETTDNGLSARYTDTIKLFEFGYNNYTLQEILDEYDSNYEIQEKEKKYLLPGIITNFGNNTDVDETGISDAIVMIIAGITILLFLIIYYIYKAIKKMKERKLYSFKIN